MNYSYKRSLLSLSLFALIFSTSIHAGPSDWIGALFSAVGKDGIIPIIKETDKGYGVDTKGLVTLAIFTVVAAKALTTVATGSYDIALPLVMKVCPIKSWKEEYNRNQEEKELDKELSLEKKRNKAIKLRQQSAGNVSGLDGLKKR